ncbi:MAG: gliding motility lipoprotein GldB [Bacteroidia bacterium]
MKLVRIAFSLSFILLLFNSCEHSLLDADVSAISVPEVKFKRLDQDLFSLTPQNFTSKTAGLQTKYGSFYNRFLFSVIRLKNNDSSQVLPFVSDKDMKNVFDESQKAVTASDLSALEGQIHDAMKRFRYFFPKRRLPEKFVAYMGGFNYNVVYVDSTIGIGLDMYLGPSHPFYTYLQWPKYKTRTMGKEYMLTDAVRGWMITEFDNTEPVSNLLNHMIFYGKIFYACDALLPDVNDSLKIGYTTKQMATCKQYEKQYWGFFAEKNRLYDNNLKTIGEFTSEGPFTGAISKECPPRIAMWVGWQIVRSYMKNNEAVSLEELMNEKDAQKILSKSKYRP